MDEPEQTLPKSFLLFLHHQHGRRRTQQWSPPFTNLSAGHRFLLGLSLLIY